DFSIHIQLALRRYEGDRLAVRRSVGTALLLAGATTVAGFGSLAFSTNTGMASLGKVCALGIILPLAIAVYLLPVWWKAWMRNDSARCFAGGDIAARCPYHSQVHGKVGVRGRRSTAWLRPR